VEVLVVVAWVSRHPPLEAQVQELKRRLGDVKIVQVSKTFASARDVVREVKAVGAKYAVLVLPLSMIAEVIKEREVAWLWAEMEGLHECVLNKCDEFNPETDVWLPLRGSDKGRHMRFKGFKRIKEVRLVLEDL